MLRTRHAAAATSLFLAHHAAADLNIWTGAIGDWADAANWSLATAPAPGDAIFITNAGTAVATNLDLILAAGGIGGAATDPIGSGNLILSGGTSNWTIQGLFLAAGENSSGSLFLTNATQVTATILSLGARGQAHTTIDAGSQVTARRLLVASTGQISGRAFNASADLTITGPGTLVRVTDPGQNFPLTIGQNGSANLLVADGATLETTSGMLVSTTAQGSSLTLDGPSTTLRFGLDSGQWFDIGRDITLPDTHPPVGDAVLTLRNNAVVEHANGLGAVRMVDNARLEGTGSIRSSVYTLGTAVIDPGEGAQHGHVTISNLLDNDAAWLAPSPLARGGTLHFDITSATDYDRLTVGALLAGGTLEVALADSYTAAFGDTFELITITDQSAFLDPDTAKGVFELVSLPALDGNLFFELAYSDTAITLTVVPAPGTLAALPLLAPRRRRRRA